MNGSAERGPPPARRHRGIPVSPIDIPAAARGTRKRFQEPKADIIGRGALKMAPTNGAPGPSVVSPWAGEAGGVRAPAWSGNVVGIAFFFARKGSSLNECVCRLPRVRGQTKPRSGAKMIRLAIAAGRYVVAESATHRSSQPVHQSVL
jgi:hypothetical protein